MITADRLKTLLTYDPTTGLFMRRAPAANGKFKQGSIAGTVQPNGYIRIKIDGVQYSAHRLAWLYVHGYLPSDWIDHKDANPSNNRVDNLRLVSPSENKMNCFVRKDNSSGCKGVNWHKHRQKWAVSCTVRGVKHYLGHFDNLEDAVRSRTLFAKTAHGEFYRDGAR